MLLRMHNSMLTKIVSRQGARPFYIYKGEMPTVDKDFVFNPANFSAQQLAKTSQSATYNILDASMNISGILTQFIPSKTGTATWFAALMTTEAASEIPKVVIGSITNDSAQKDPLLLSAVDFVVGEPVSFIDFKFKLGV